MVLYVHMLGKAVGGKALCQSQITHDAQGKVLLY